MLCGTALLRLLRLATLETDIDHDVTVVAESTDVWRTIESKDDGN